MFLALSKVDNEFGAYTSNFLCSYENFVEEIHHPSLIKSVPTTCTHTLVYDYYMVTSKLEGEGRGLLHSWRLDIERDVLEW